MHKKYIKPICSETEAVLLCDSLKRSHDPATILLHKNTNKSTWNFHFLVAEKRQSSYQASFHLISQRNFSFSSEDGNSVPELRTSANAIWWIEYIINTEIVLQVQNHITLCLVNMTVLPFCFHPVASDANWLRQKEEKSHTLFETEITLLKFETHTVYLSTTRNSYPCPCHVVLDGSYHNQYQETPKWDLC